MLGKKLINSGPISSGANTFASENFNTVLYTGNGGAQRIGGYINRGAVFNGSNSSILLPSNIDDPLRSANSFGISLWFKTPSGNQVNSYGGKIISLLNDIYCFISIETNNTLLARVQQSNSTSREVTTTALSANTWYHIVFTGNSTNGVTLYLNNSSQGNVTWDGTFSTYTNSNYKFNYIGYQGSNVSYLTGTVDQVRFFKKGLSSSEVTTLYGETFASTTISTTDIFDDNSGVALYQLDGNANDTGLVAAGTIVSSNKIIDLNVDSYTSGTTIDDSTSNNNDATIVGDVSYDNWLGRGRFDLQGSSDYLKIDASTTFNGATNLTLEGWFRPDNLTATDHFFTIYNTSGSSQKLYLRLNDTDGDIDMHAYGSGGAGGVGSLVTNNSSVRVQANKWNHIVGVWESGTAMSVYINGALAGTTSLGNINTAGTEDLYIGVIKGYIGTYDFDGEVGEIRGYSSALTASEVLQNFNATRYYYAAYDGTASNITYQEATKFTPDLVWIKARNIAYNHRLFDSVRTLNGRIESNTTAAEVSNTVNDNFVSFDSNGFTLGATSSTNGSNDNTQPFVAWCFNAGSGSSASNTDGSITSTVKANTDAGFSIVKYIGNATDNATVGTGLSTAARLVIVKDLDNTQYWVVGGEAVGDGKTLYLNDSGGLLTRDRVKSVQTNTFTLGSHFESNGSSVNFIAYCFHDVADYQKIGSYSGNGSTNGTFVETDFEPAFLMIKKTNGTGSWYMYDNKRTTSNPRNIILQANESAAEGGTSYSHLDFLSNGFQLKTTNAEFNGSSDTYIYLAIAADPDQTDPTVENSFDVVTYSGTGSSQTIQTDFKPDLVWTKVRTTSDQHSLATSVLGTGILESNTTSAFNSSYTSLTLEDNGFTVGSSNQVNASGENFVAWAWKAGDHDDSLPQINTEGTIDSIVSVNDAAGFSIVKYTGNGGSGQSVGHGLSSAPEMVIFKRTNASVNWFVFVKVGGVYKRFEGLNTTAAATSVSSFSASSTTITWSGTTSDFNGSGNEYIIYCWYSITGHSKIGSYQGTGATGNTQTLGFRPRFIMIKSSSNAEPWFLLDSKRNPTNPVNNRLMADSTASESANSVHTVDFTNTGFTANGTVGNGTNGNGVDYIYMAFK